MTTIDMGEIRLNEEDRAILRDCIRPRAQRERVRVTILIDKHLMDKYEADNRRMRGGRFTGEGLSNSLNKAFTFYLSERIPRAITVEHRE